MLQLLTFLFLLPAAATDVALVPKEYVALLQAHLSEPWRLVAAEEAGDEDVAQAKVIAPSFVMARNATAFYGMLDKMKAGQLLQWLATGVDLLNYSRIPSHFAICNVHQAGVAISEYVIAALLSWNIKLAEMDAEFRRCTWRADKTNSCQMSRPHKTAFGQTIGVIGLGTIGIDVAAKASALGMRVVGVDTRAPSALPPYMAWVGGDDKLPQLMAESDFVVIAVPLVPATKGLIGAESLKKMKPDGVLINIARGPIVDEVALYEALRDKKIGGAVLDVWWNDFSWYRSGTWPSAYNFSELDNVVITPHASANTLESVNETLDQTASNLKALLHGQPLRNVVRNASFASETLAFV